MTDLRFTNWMCLSTVTLYWPRAPNEVLSTRRGFIRTRNRNPLLILWRLCGISKNDVFVHISAVERAGLSRLVEGQKVTFEIKTDKMRGKVSAENLSLV